MPDTFDLSFYKGKRVFVTGHTGFKGSWLCHMLVNAGAEVTGYSLMPPTEPSLFKIAEIEKDIHSIIGDIRDYERLKEAFTQHNQLSETVIRIQGILMRLMSWELLIFWSV